MTIFKRIFIIRRLRRQREAALARHKDALARKDARSIHHTREALRKATHAVMRVEGKA